jgi:hypothetical protein
MSKKELLILLGAGDKVGFIQPEYKGEKVYGVTWDKTANALVRTNASIGMVAAAGVDAGTVTNDFDTADIFKDIIDATDAYGNEFRGLPGFYIRKTDTPTFKSWQISKAKLPGSYKSWGLYNFSTGTYNDYIYVGKYVAGNNGTKLTSVANVYPTINQNIVTFRTWAKNNGTGYQQLDIHVMDMLQVLFTIEFATLDSQAIMAGWTSGTFGTTEVLTADTSSANTIVVSNATGAKFAIGQPVGLGTSQGGNQIFYGRNITNIQVDTPGAGSTTITVDGAAFNASTGNYLYNVGWKSGFSSGIAATSGSLANNTNGKNPFHYRGIENLNGNVWQFMDGYNINDYQGWFCKDANGYASNVFAAPYEKIGYVNGNTNGYTKYMGFDPANPMIEMPVDVSSNFYKDYYFRDAGQRIAIVGGNWVNGGYSGLWFWVLNNSSSLSYVTVGGRLCTKAVSV